MSDQLEDAARLAVEEALAAGGDEADAWCEDAVERSVRVYDGAVESMTEAGSKGAGVRVFREGRSGYAYGSDLSEEGLRSLARAAAEAASVTEADEYAGIAPPAEPADVGGLVAPEFRRLDHGAARRACAGRRAGRSRAATRSSATSRTPSTPTARAVRRSQPPTASAASFEQTQCYAYAYAFAGEGADRMTGIGLAVARGPDGIEPEAVGAEAADRAVALHGARQPQSRRCPVVLDPHVAASFASVIGRTLSADAVQRGRSLFAGKEGEQIADPALRLLDDGLDPEGLATAPFDGEGVPQQSTALIEDGKLRTYLFDAYTARKAGRESTGNGARGSYRAPPSVGPTNLLVAPGSGTTADLIAEAGDGLYVMGVSGLHSGVNAISGSFSVGATGRLIRNGELAEAGPGDDDRLGPGVDADRGPAGRWGGALDPLRWQREGAGAAGP